MNCKLEQLEHLHLSDADQTVKAGDAVTLKKPRPEEKAVSTETTPTALGICAALATG
jgi:hypothetical protein